MVGHGSGKCNSWHVTADLLNVLQPPFYTLSLHTFLHMHNHLSTPSHWTRSTRIIYDDVGLKEKPFMWQRNETQSTDSVGNYFVSNFRRIIIFIMDHPPGHTFYDMWDKGCLLSPVSSMGEPFSIQKHIMHILCPIRGKDAVDSAKVMMLKPWYHWTHGLVIMIN